MDCTVTEMLAEQSDVKYLKWNETYPKIIQATKEALEDSKEGT